MSITIKNISDIERFKTYITNNPAQPICYVFYKNNMRFPNVYYIGFTNQKGINKYKYLNNHHTMKNNLITNLKNGYSIQIYTKYSENGLIKLLKPKLNRQCGTGMVGYRDCCIGDLRAIGEIIGINYEKNFKRKINKSSYFEDDVWTEIEDLWEKINNKLVCGLQDNYGSINYELMVYIIEKYKVEKMNDSDRKIIDDPLFNIAKKEVKSNYNSTNILTYEKLLSILTFCKLDKIHLAYIIIHEIFKKNILWHICNLNKNENKCSCGKEYKKKGFLTKHLRENNHNQKEDLFNYITSSINKHIICIEILEELKKNDYLISKYDDNNYKLWYYYRYQKEIYNACLSLIKYNMQINYSPYDLHLIVNVRNEKDTLEFYSTNYKKFICDNIIDI